MITFHRFDSLLLVATTDPQLNRLTKAPRFRYQLVLPSPPFGIVPNSWISMAGSAGMAEPYRIIIQKSEAPLKSWTRCTRPPQPSGQGRNGACGSLRFRSIATPLQEHT